MRYIKIPEDAELTYLINKEDGEHPKISFYSFMVTLLIKHEDAFKTKEATASYAEVRSSLKDKKPGDIWEITNGNHEFMGELVKTFKYEPPELKVCILDFANDFLNAPSKNPTIVENGANKKINKAEDKEVSA